MISIRGERHTGTNWLRQIINQNCPGLKWQINESTDADGKYGWKHSILPDDFKLNETDVMIFIYRDFKTWAPKMYQEPYAHVPFAKSKPKIDFSTFLTQHWDTREQLNDKHPEHWDNLFNMRSEKYKSWMKFAMKHPANAIGVSYEDLVENQEVFYRIIVDKFKLHNRCNEHFKKVSNYSKFGKMQRKKFIEKKFTWLATDLETTYSKLDRSLESSLGYLH